MKDEPEDIDEWCRQLSGQAPSGATSKELAVLREAIRASDRAASEAAAADQVGHARLIERLKAEGLLGRERPARSRWPLWLASAAGVLLAIVAVRFLMPDVIYRGSAGSIAIVSAQPELEREQVVQQLRALGFDPRVITVDGRVVIEVDVSKAQLDVFYEWARLRGARALISGTYQIFVTAQDP